MTSHRFETKCRHYNCFVILTSLVLVMHVQPSHGVFFFENNQRCNCRPDKDCSQSPNGTGRCTHCDGPFLGVTCQHVSLGHPDMNKHIYITALKDNDDTTCVNETWDGKATFKAPANHSLHFIWAYIVRKRTTGPSIKPHLALYNRGKNMTVEFYVLKFNRNSFLTKLGGDSLYDKLELSNLPQDICSLEVSVGRNLANFSDPWIRFDNDSSVSTPADLYRASDGHEKHYYTLYTDGGEVKWWRTRLKHDAKVNAIRILHNLEQKKCWKCLVHVFTSNTSLVLNQEAEVIDRPILFYVAVDATFREVELTFQKKTHRILNYCRHQDVVIEEVYILGEFQCPDNMCGVLCENRCPEGCSRKMCDPDWGCTDECKQKKIFDQRSQREPEQCDDFTYGPNCEHKCHDNCANEGLCDEVNGTCLDGCKPGFKLPDCETPCENGTYSVNCSKTCTRCAKNSTTGEHICDHDTGHCQFGCDKGYGGDTCEKLIVISNIYSLLTAKNVACSCVLAVLLVSLLRSYIRRRTDAFVTESDRIRPDDGTELYGVEESEPSTMSNLPPSMESQTIRSILGNDSSCAEESGTSVVTGSTPLGSSTDIGPGSTFIGQSANSTMSTNWSSDAASSMLIIVGQKHTDI